MSAALTAVIVVCNYRYFPHRWSFPASTSKQSSAMLTSLNAVIVRTELPPNLSLLGKRYLKTVNVKCVFPEAATISYVKWKPRCLNKIIVC